MMQTPPAKSGNNHQPTMTCVCEQLLYCEVQISLKMLKHGRNSKLCERTEIMRVISVVCGEEHAALITAFVGILWEFDAFLASLYVSRLMLLSLIKEISTACVE